MTCSKMQILRKLINYLIRRKKRETEKLIIENRNLKYDWTFLLLVEENKNQNSPLKLTPQLGE